MELIFLLMIMLVLTLVALAPCFLFWFFVLKALPQKYKLKPILFTLMCFILALATAFAINLKLEGGALSGVIAVFAFSLVWAFLLAIANLAAKLISNMAAMNQWVESKSMGSG